MADSKIDFSFENLHFSCEGENAWVERQLNNVLSRIPVLLSVHRKGENIVEEVIDVEEEDVKEVRTKAPRSSKKIAKGSRGKTVKKVKEKIGKLKNTKEAKVKVAKNSADAEILKEKADQLVNEAFAGETIKRGRKPKIVEKSAVKAKIEKKKITKINPAAEQIDSPLYQYLKSKKVGNNQVRKFLATAIFLARNNNLSRLTTPMISRALKSYGIDKLQNASDCLNKNEKKGYCIKDGKEFIITENGYLSIE